jgi:osmotically-inducible protein OsmY
MKVSSSAIILGVFATAMMYADPSSSPTIYQQKATYNYTQDNYAQGYAANSEGSANSSAATVSGDNKYPTEKKYPRDQFKTEVDRATNNRIRNQITGWFSDNYNEIILRTSDGIVIIDGFVSSPENQKKLREEIDKVNGVKHTINNAKVKPKK